MNYKPGVISSEKYCIRAIFFNLMVKYLFILAGTSAASSGFSATNFAAVLGHSPDENHGLPNLVLCDLAVAGGRPCHRRFELELPDCECDFAERFR